MKIVLATGIYPPDIGGPATYVRNLAEEVSKKRSQVTVVTYGESGIKNQESRFSVVRVSKNGGPILRWLRYARALKQHAEDADIVEAFSSISVGIPLRIARLKKPKAIIRLGGDFMWERYTGRGGRLGLDEWYRRRPKSCWFMERLLNSFHHVIFSTSFQQEIYRRYYRLKDFSVIENASVSGKSEWHKLNQPMRIMFAGRFVKFKNIPSLIQAMIRLPDANLTLVGDGPEAANLKALVEKLALQERALFVGPTPREQLQKIFSVHDLMVLPSFTEISPNVALEARACGLPVLLSRETGLSRDFTNGMVVRELKSPEQIAAGIDEIKRAFPFFAEAAAKPAPVRSFQDIAAEHLNLFDRLISNDTAARRAAAEV